MSEHLKTIDALADEEAVRARLQQFAGWTNTTPPATILDAEGAPTAELLQYAHREELNLDWLFVGDARAAVLAYRSRHIAGGWDAVSRRVKLMSEVSGIPPVEVETEPEDHGIACSSARVRVTDALLQFAGATGADLDWLLHGEVRGLIERSREGNPALPEAPVQALFRSWLTLFLEIKALLADDPAGEVVGEKVDELCAAQYAIEDEMEAVPSTTPADIAAKVAAGVSMGEMCFERLERTTAWKEALAMRASLGRAA